MAVRLLIRVARAHVPRSGAEERVIISAAKRAVRRRRESARDTVRVEICDKVCRDGPTNENVRPKVGGCVRDVPGRDALG